MVVGCYGYNIWRQQGQKGRTIKNRNMSFLPHHFLIIFTMKFRNRKRDNNYIPETSALQILIIIMSQYETLECCPHYE